MSAHLDCTAADGQYAKHARLLSGSACVPTSLKRCDWTVMHHATVKSVTHARAHTFAVSCKCSAAAGACYKLATCVHAARRSCAYKRKVLSAANMRKIDCCMQHVAKTFPNKCEDHIQHFFVRFCCCYYIFKFFFQSRLIFVLNSRIWLMTTDLKWSGDSCLDALSTLCGTCCSQPKSGSHILWHNFRSFSLKPSFDTTYFPNMFSLNIYLCTVLLCTADLLAALTHARTL